MKIELLQNKRFAQIVALLFAILLLFTLYKKALIFLPASQTKQTKVSQPEVKQLPDIAAMHLFGDYAVTQANLLPQTTLNLVLEGVFYGGLFPQAIIAEPGKKAKVYRVDQTVPGGATIKKILPKGVVLEQNNKKELLPLKIKSLKFAPQPKVGSFAQPVKEASN